MKKIHFDKNITVFKKIGRLETILTIKYKDFAREVENDQQLDIQFPKGDYKRRMKLIQDLGYKVTEWIWKPVENASVSSLYRVIVEKN